MTLTNPAFPNPFKDPFQGTVDVNGNLTIRFGPQYNNTWTVEQVTLEMETAPVGAIATLRVMGSLIDTAQSARRAAAAQEPPVFLYGGETMTVEWTDATPGDIGRVFVIYRKGVY